MYDIQVIYMIVRHLLKPTSGCYLKCIHLGLDPQEVQYIDCDFSQCTNLTFRDRVGIWQYIHANRNPCCVNYSGSMSLLSDLFSKYLSQF